MSSNGNIAKIKLPDDTTYDIVDKVSGYTTNTGTVTSVAISGGTGISISGSPITTNGTITVTNSGVTSIKGNSESSYRTGQVNLTAANIGAIPANSNGNTQNLYRPLQLNGLGDVTLDAKINTLRANRLAFLPADQIIIEKTTDGGSTWTDAGVADSTKVGLFSETRAGVSIPLLNGVKNINCGLRITITGMKYNIPSGTAETSKYNYWNSNYIVSTERYNQLKEMYFWVSANSDTISVKVERATGAASTTWNTIFDNSSYGMTGWSGNDYIRFAQGVFGGGTNQTSNYWNYRLTFFTRGPGGSTTLSGTNTTSAQSINEIRGYGDTWWTAGNEYAANDKLYTHDYLKNATFPAKVTANGGFSGNLTGNVTGNCSGTAGGVAWANVSSKPTATGSATTGITIADHGTGTITGVQSSTTSVRGVKTGTNSTTTASKVTLGTAISVPNVTNNDNVTVPIRDDSDTTVPIAASSATTVPIKATSATTVPIKNENATSIPNVTNVGSASTWEFEEKTIPNVTAAGSGSASLTFTMDTTDTKKLKIAFSHTHTAPTIGTAIKVQSKKSGTNGTAPTLGTAISVIGVQSSTTSVTGVQSSTTSVTGVSGSTSVRGVKTGDNSTTTASKVTLGTAKSIPNVTAATDVIVPIAADSDTTVPIKNTNASTFVTGTTHTITDNGHTHTI